MLIVLSVSGGFLILIYSMFGFYVMMNQQRGLFRPFDFTNDIRIRRKTQRIRRI